MPFDNRWEPPALFMTHRGVDIYHAYKDDEIQEMLTFWYSVQDPSNEGEYLEFDVRDLPKYESHEIFLDEVKGDDSNNGWSPSTPVKTLKKAQELKNAERMKFQGKDVESFEFMKAAIVAAIDSGALFTHLGIPSQISEDEKTYEVDVMRVATCGKTFTVQATSPGEAEKKALEQAYDTVIDNEADAEYHANVSGPAQVPS